MHSTRKKHLVPDKVRVNCEKIQIFALIQLFRPHVRVLVHMRMTVELEGVGMNSMKLVIPLHSLYGSIHTKDESKHGTAFAFIFGVN